MTRRNPGSWMWADAVDLLEQAERLHRQFFRLAGAPGQPRWEPPADVYETAGELLVVVALPGVPPDRVQLGFEAGELVIRAQRALPRQPGAAILRLEIPYGVFERRIALPPGRYELAASEHRDGCLQLLIARH